MMITERWVAKWGPAAAAVWRRGQLVRVTAAAPRRLVGRTGVVCRTPSPLDPRFPYHVFVLFDGQVTERQVRSDWLAAWRRPAVPVGAA